MSLQLYTAINNARDQLQPVLAAYGAGELADPWLPLGLSLLFRQHGTCRMLLEGIAAPLYIGQMQSASVYLARLSQIADEDKAASFAAPWWDAIAGGYWDAAQEIAEASRRTYNPKREHEDDFLYIDFLMHRHFLTPDPTDAVEQEAWRRNQASRLERWETVLEGEQDPRLDLCRALEERDGDGFQRAIVEIGEHRRADLDRREANDTLEPDFSVWMKHVWPEGLALLRLAERENLGTEFDCPYVPPLIRIDPPFRYDPRAWQDLDYRPTSLEPSA